MLAQVDPAANSPFGRESELSRIQMFEIEQVLGAKERGESIHAVVREEPVVYIGKIAGFSAAGVQPSSMIQIVSLDDVAMSFRFSEIRIDPFDL